MHSDARNALAAMFLTLCCLGGMIGLCFATWGTAYFSGAFVLTMVFLGAVKIYVLR